MDEKLREFKTRVDEYIGLVSEVEKVNPASPAAHLIYKSPKGIVLFELTIRIYDIAKGWEVGSISGALPRDVDKVWEGLGDA